MVVGGKDVLTPQAMEYFRKVLTTPYARSACAALPGAIVGATDWLGSIWDDRRAFSGLPSLILCGMKDIAFQRKALERWQSELADSKIHEVRGCGNFLAEETPDRVLTLLASFLARTWRT